MLSKPSSKCLPPVRWRTGESLRRRRRDVAVYPGFWKTKSNHVSGFRLGRILCSAAQLFAVVALAGGGNADYRARFQAANRAHEAEKAEAIPKEWKAASPGDPEYYIASANFVLN